MKFNKKRILGTIIGLVALIGLGFFFANYRVVVPSELGANKKVVNPNPIKTLKKIDRLEIVNPGMERFEITVEMYNKMVENGSITTLNCSGQELTTCIENAVNEVLEASGFSDVPIRVKGQNKVFDYKQKKIK